KPHDCRSIAGDDEATRKEQGIAIDAAFQQVQEDVKIAFDRGVSGSLTHLLQDTDGRLLVAAVLQLETMRQIGGLDVNDGGLQARQILKKFRVGALHSPKKSANRARQ